MGSRRQQRQAVCSSASSRAPLIAPMTVPLPPERLAPPMMTAAKTGNVKERPMFGCAVWMNEKSSTPGGRREHAADDEGEDLVAGHGKAGELRRHGIAADRHQPEAEQRAMQQEADHQRQPEHPDDLQRNGMGSETAVRPVKKSSWASGISEPCGG